MIGYSHYTSYHYNTVYILSSFSRNEDSSYSVGCICKSEVRCCICCRTY